MIEANRKRATSMDDLSTYQKYQICPNFSKETDYLESINKWGELDQDAEHTEEITSRLAVCNMDWDKVNADDIFLVR